MDKDVSACAMGLFAGLVSGTSLPKSRYCTLCDLDELTESFSRVVFASFIHFGSCGSDNNSGRF